MKARTVLLTSATGLVVMHRLGTSLGATRAERRAVLPGDEIISCPNIETTHGRTIAAPPSEVWPWLVQVGWHQGGWYTARWVDRLLFPDNWPSADRIIPELQARAVGDFIPDGAPETGCGFSIEVLEPRETLVLHSTTHLPLSWRRRFGVHIDWTWSFRLLEETSGDTRLVFRTRGRIGPSWAAALYHLAIVPADAVMSRQMLRGLTDRATRHLGGTARVS